MYLIYKYLFFYLGNEFNPDDPLLNGTVARIVFEAATEKVEDDWNLFFKMYLKSTTYSFALSVSEKIQK